MPSGRSDSSTERFSGWDIIPTQVPYWKNPALLLELEAIILRATEPPYNVQIHAGVLTYASETFRANLVH